MTEPAPTAPRGASVRGILRGGGAALAAIVALGAALRFATIDVQGFADDELYTAWLVRMPFADMLESVPETEATPHLFYVLEWGFAQVLGTGEAGLRVLPALAGTLTVPVAYAIGALGASRRVGLAAAAVVAVNPFLAWYSQEARGYSLMILLVALSVLWLVVFARTGERSALLAWGAASAAALATHYFAAFVLVAEAAWVLRARGAPLATRAAALAIPAVVGLALAPLAAHQRTAVGDPGGTDGSPLGERLAAIPKNFLVGFSIPAEAVVSALAGALAAVALVLAVRTSGDERRLAAAMAALAAAGVALPLLVAPFGLDYASSRTVIAALLPFAVLLACGFSVGRAGPPALAALCVVSVATAIGVAANEEHQRRDWRGALEAVGPARADRVLVFAPRVTPLGPFEVYAGDVRSVDPDRTTRARELVVVALAERTGFGPGAPRPPEGFPPRAPEGFRMVADVSTDTYTLVRFAAPRPRPVVPRFAHSSRFDAVDPMFLRETGGPR